MNDKHPITPPPELVNQWCDEDPGGFEMFDRLATKAARWGADQELEAILKLAGEPPLPEWDRCFVASLREERRPKPPTLKEQALDELVSAERLYPADWSTIRKALEALPE